MSCPDFVCMGFQKCGTTTLYEIIKQHPEVALCRDVKEPMFYRTPRLFFRIMGGNRFYQKRYFGHIPKDDPRLKGEINAGLTYSFCAERLKEDFDPDVKMIFMMRNPADRSYSAYKYFLARGFLPASAIRYDARHGHAEGFDHYVHSVLGSKKRRSEILKRPTYYMTISQSLYAANIRQYQDTFSPDNMKYVIFEEFVQDEHKACREIYDFLGISDPEGINYSIRANEGKERALSVPMAKWYRIMKGSFYVAYEFLEMPRRTPKTYSYFHRYFKYTRGRAMGEDFDHSRMLPETREYLMRYYASDIRELSRMTGKDLRKIWK